jgi:hypothetical protein
MTEAEAAHYKDAVNVEGSLRAIPSGANTPMHGALLEK